MKKNIYIASDHAGLSLKTFLVKNCANFEWHDLGPSTEDSVDYPDYADLLADKIKTENDLGVLICGSGQGMSIRANKYPHIRAALCWSEEISKLAREHNNANVLCLGGRVTAPELAQKILQIFMTTEFAGGRHLKRVNKISSPLKKVQQK